MEQRQGNYQIMAEHARALFLKEDQDKLIQKFHLKADNSYLYLRFLDGIYRIERNSGYIQKTTDNELYTADNDFHTAMSIFDYLCWSREDRQLSGQWISMQNIGHSYHNKLMEGDGSSFKKWADQFAEHTEKLKEACEHLNGYKMPVGDVSYIIPLFDELPVYFQFWDGDDEFPPKLFTLWDANTQQYVHYETLYYILPMLFNRLQELMENGYEK